ncbi:MAG TPA: hypothetical protein VGC42_07660 [Kofleriaceae bacterium]
MTAEIVSPGVFNWILTASVGVVSAIWVAHDILFFARLRNADGQDPLIRDQRFGYAVGVVIGVIGVVGALMFMRHNGVI